MVIAGTNIPLIGFETITNYKSELGHFPYKCLTQRLLGKLPLLSTSPSGL